MYLCPVINENRDKTIIRRAFLTISIIFGLISPAHAQTLPPEIGVFKSFACTQFAPDMRERLSTVTPQQWEDNFQKNPVIKMMFDILKTAAPEDFGHVDTLLEAKPQDVTNLINAICGAEGKEKKKRAEDPQKYPQKYPQEYPQEDV